MPLHTQFCWTRFGTEAGEKIETILDRKEDERKANNGIFLWGIGNGLKPSMLELVRNNPEPEIVFSPIRSAPRKVDVAPETVVIWLAGRTMEDKHYNLPRGSFVTSRASKRPHYALVCSSETPLTIDPEGDTFTFNSLRNLVSGNPVGASQVTAVVQHDSEEVDNDSIVYTVALRAKLVPPYFIRLTEPCEIENTKSNSDISSIRQEAMKKLANTSLPLFA